MAWIQAITESLTSLAMTVGSPYYTTLATVPWPTPGSDELVRFYSYEDPCAHTPNGDSVVFSTLSGTGCWIQVKPRTDALTSAQVTGALGFTPYNATNPNGFITSSSLGGYVTSTSLTATLGGYTTTTALTASLATKFNIPTGTTSQYVRGDGSIATLPASIPFNYGAINQRTFAVSTAYQAIDNTKAAVIKVSPSCTASLSLSAGGTCTIQARVGSSGLTCSTGTVVATWTNANTGTLTVGLGLNQTIGAPGNIELAIGEYFILCATSGTFTIANGIDRSQG